MNPEPEQRFSRSMHACNLFPSTPLTNDRHTRRNQLFAAIIFIIIFAAAFAALMYFTVTTDDTITVQQASSPTCSCTRVAINYGDFISLNYTMHPICSSDFISDAWLSYLQMTTNGSVPLVSVDYHYWMMGISQALRTLCRLAQSTIVNKLMDFYFQQYISTNLVPPMLFNAQIQASVDGFQVSAANEFISSLNTVQEIIQSNSLFSTFMSNAAIYSTSNNTYVSMVPKVYGNCSCSSTSTCVSPAAFYSPTTYQVLWNVSGMLIGCYVLPALMQSTLECFYDQNCFNQMLSYLSLTIAWNGQILNGTQMSRFMPTTPVGDIVQSLMVDMWTVQVSYQAYYDGCASLQCNITMIGAGAMENNYTFKRRQSAIFMVTTAIGLIGGLVTILKSMVAVAMRFKRGRTVPATMVMENGIPRFSSDVHILDARPTIID